MFANPENDAPATPPRPEDADGAARLVGVEIELGGLSEADAAATVAEILGGEARIRDGAEWLVSGGALGDVEVLLDTRFRRKLADAGGADVMSAARAVIPVEIVCAPARPSELVEIDRLCAALRARGASGSRDGMLLGLGVHLNVTATGETLDDILPTLTAYALLEDLLRRQMKIDAARRLLPFTDPYPRALVDALAEAPPQDMDGLVRLYLEHTPTRNRGLDMLPLLATVAPRRVAAASRDSKPVSARPAYHYRLPDSRIDEPDWSVTLEWNRWVEIERVAAAPDLLDALKEGWRAHRASWTTIRGDWADKAAEICADHAR